MGLSTVVENFRALKKTVKKPIVAFRETVHNVYTKAYVGSPERVDEFYTYIKVYKPSKHNDLCMMSITADINRFSMLPDKHTFFHVHKLERHFDRMIATHNIANVNGDMAIQILSGHNITFMAKYRRYKARAATKEMKRNEKRHKALNVKRHTQLPHQTSSSSSSSSDSDVYPDAKPAPAPLAPAQKILSPPPILPVATSVASKTVEVTAASEDDKELEEILKSINEYIVNKMEVSVVCELTKPESVVAAPLNNDSISAMIPMKEEDITDTSSALRANKVSQKKHAKAPTVPKKLDTTQKKFKPAKPIGTAKKAEKSVAVKKAEPVNVSDLLDNVMEQLNLEDQKKTAPKSQIVVDSSDSESHDEFDNCDDSDDTDDGSDIEELEKIEDKDVDALEYEMI